LHYVASSVVRGSRAITAGAQATASGVGSGVAFIARGVGIGIMFVVNTVAGMVIFVLQIPINLFGFISNTQAVSAVIEPADTSQVPIIDPNDPELLAALQALPAMETAGHSTESPMQEAVWPIHGQITTHFGEKGRFYRSAHTGIDISDGKRSGVTPIKAFRRGKVLAVTRNSGLGNHVILDHGNGITSVYAHLSSSAVQVGQDADTSTTLGFQGSTGVSTGPHLHFEIRVNGQATDPRPFIAGQP
jgi:murein DD-endopeptidase MepM/ murein hydrolase activator NlpD